MGRLDFLRRGKKTKQVADKTYILTKKNEKTGGMEKVLDLAKNMTPDELYSSLTAGVYAVHIYSKGQSGFESGPMFEVDADVGEKPEKGVVKRSALGSLKETLQEFKETKEEMKEFAALAGELFSDKKVTMDDAMSYFETLKKHKDTLDGLFPSSTTKSNEIAISGSIPAWLAYLPQAIDQSMNALEQRLTRWGLVDSGASQTMSRDEDPIHLPDKPKVVTTTKEKEESKGRDTEILINLPSKPVPKVEEKEKVREAEITEEKEEGEEKDGKEESE